VGHGCVTGHQSTARDAEHCSGDRASAERGRIKSRLTAFSRGGKLVQIFRRNLALKHALHAAVATRRTALTLKITACAASELLASGRTKLANAKPRAMKKHCPA
jgi:hypothetical protein